MDRILQELRTFYQDMGSSELFRAIRPNVCTKYTKMTQNRKHPVMKNVNMGCLGVSRAYHRDAFTSSRPVRTPRRATLGQNLVRCGSKKIPHVSVQLHSSEPTIPRQLPRGQEELRSQCRPVCRWTRLERRGTVRLQSKEEARQVVQHQKQVVEI